MYLDKVASLRRPGRASSINVFLNTSNMVVCKHVVFDFALFKVTR